jgi:salicylate hydroxylase
MRTWSVAVAGAGPAGLAAALCLHRDGHRVTVFERFSAPQPIGAGLMLQPTGLAVLRELGLAEKVLARGRRIDRMFGRVLPSRRTVLDLHYRTLAPDAFGLAVHRATLFTPLFDAVRESSIAIETGRTVTGAEQASGGQRRLVFSDGSQSAAFDLVVDALGMRSPLAPIYDGGARHDLAYGALWTTLPWPQGHFDEHALEQRYRSASVMIGLLPIGRRTEDGPQETVFFWSLKSADYGAWREAGLSAWKERALELWPETAVLCEQITSPDQFTLARYAHYTVMRPIAAAFAAIGDSAHAASPQLGQGANMALLDAYALAFALRGSADLAEALRTYATLRRWHIRFYQSLSAMFTPFYQSDSGVLPPLRDWIVAPATRLPVIRGFVAAMVAGTIFDPRRTLGLDREFGARPRS